MTNSTRLQSLESLISKAVNPLKLLCAFLDSKDTVLEKFLEFQFVRVEGP